MTLTRRHFLATLAATAAVTRLPAEGPRNAKSLLLGTDKGKGIYRAAWNPLTGEIGPPTLAAPCDRPTYFARNPKHPILYTANESAQGDGSVSAFRLDDHSELTLLNTTGTLGNGPCYVSVDEYAHSVFAANYGGGNIAAIGLQPDGSLAPQASTFNCKDNLDCGVTGPNPRQDAPHLHCAVLSPDNHYLLCCNLGEDAIEVIPILPGPVSSEILGTPVRFAARPGSGPRHLAFHPNGRFVYCIHELDCTLDVYSWNKGRLTLLGDSTVSTLGPNAAPQGNTACEVLVSANGRFVYANTRGENSLAVFRINEKTGFLTEQQRVPTGGTVTRLLAFDPSQRWLLAMNQGSSTVSVFTHDPKTGKLSGKLSDKPALYPAETPMCVEWV